MKHITSIIAKALFTILISGGLSAASIQAQDTNGVEATIPFEFSAHRQNMAAGVYELKLLSDPFLLSIRNVNTGRKRILMVRQQDSQSAAAHGYLTFRRDAGHIDLAEIHFQGTHVYSVLIQKQYPDAANVRVASSNSSTNIALR